MPRPRKTPKLSVESINQSLADAGMPVTLEATTSRGALRLRATFPPKPGSDKNKPHRQRLSLNTYDTPEGLEYAKAEAFKIGAQLLRHEFEWPIQTTERDPIESTAGYWIDKFKAQWLETQTGLPEALDKRWRENYWYPCFKHLDPTRKLTTVYLSTVASNQWRPNSRSKQKGVQLLSRLADMAGMDFDASNFKSGYNPNKVKREIPTDDQIESVIDNIKNRKWQWVAGMMATYGLRDHEVFVCQLEQRVFKNRTVLIALVPEETKTGSRPVLPLPEMWIKRWRLDEVDKPKVTAVINKDYGDRVSTQFQRMKIPFPAYSLRHAWNIRAALQAELPTAVAAQLAGHDPGTNLRVYQKHIGEARAQEAWLKATQNAGDDE
ncbi:hypothetical protein Lepto7375DRAFT_7179 [Leptolyngbya sp. PCC 7375]|nr:hypothetical protein Lepto7375DRAFT_7179 [Leptolyngbya sp. PCC 7375]